jgi:hypothetical protein
MSGDHDRVEHEPALRRGSFAPDPSENTTYVTPDTPTEIDALRDSVSSEPHLGDGKGHFGSWLAERRRQTSPAGNLGATLLAALAGGPFAIIGAFVAGQSGLTGAIYVVVFGPVIEELLKQSGMIYLLERQPYRVFSAWQFVAVAAASAIIFAGIENLLYIHVYASQSDIANLELFARFRWTVCTALHVSCAIVASLGLVRVWRAQLADGAPADLSHAYPLFVTAMIIHGCYNLVAMLFSDIF